MVNNIEDADVHRARNGAMTAAYAQVHAKPFFIIDKFMHRTLSPPAVFGGSRVMSPRHQCKIDIVAGVITFIPHACILYLFVGDLETMASRTDKGTCVTAHTIG